MTRDEFLSQHWLPYPTIPGDAVAWGRVVRAEPPQLTLNRDGEDAGFVVRDGGLLSPGDWVAVNALGEWTLLAPAKAKSRETRASARVLRDWSLFREAVRGFFRDRGFLETPTPTLVPCPGTEPTLDVFSTELRVGSRQRTVYLPTSPELHLKKLLAQGFSKIFEMKTCYRNGEITRHHQPEFLMLEWYRAGETLDAIADDAAGLCAFLAAKFGRAGARSVRRATMAELFREHAGAEIRPSSTLEDYAAIARAAGLRLPPGATIDDVFFLIFIEKIEPAFAADELVVVRDWPPFQAALARLSPEGWAERFEIYWRGLEIANAFHELNDPGVQRARFAQDQAKKIASGRPPVPLDQEFLRALDAGMPPSSGIALGVERLFMALFGIDDIAAIRPFPLED